MKKYSIAIIGATGAVGQQVLKWLHKLNFPFSSIAIFASKKSAGRSIHYQNFVYTVQELTEESFIDKDICFFCANDDVSKHYVPYALKHNCLVIDNSTIYRLDKNVPLIMPYVNPQAYHKNKKLISNPNCATSILCSVLKPLDDLFSIKKVVVSTFQSVSGIGFHAIQDLKYQTRSDLDNVTYQSPYFPNLKSKVKYHMAFNCLPQVGTMLENGSTSEEEKVRNETQKILDKKIEIIPTCIRVPTLHCHCETVYIEFDKTIDIKTIYKKINKCPDLKLCKKLLPSNSICKDRLEVFVSRIRKMNDHAISLYIVGDNLLKGAATNAIDIAFLAIKEE